MQAFLTVFYQFLGAVLIVAGVPIFWLPIPLGAVMILLGLALLIANSPTLRDALRRWRSRHPRADDWLRKAERRTPGPFRRILQSTDGAQED